MILGKTLSGPSSSYWRVGDESHTPRTGAAKKIELDQGVEVHADSVRFGRGGGRPQQDQRVEARADGIRLSADLRGLGSMAGWRA